MTTAAGKRSSFRRRIWAGASLLILVFMAEGGISLVLSLRTQDFLNPVRIEHVSLTNVLHIETHKLKELLEEYATTGEPSMLKEIQTQMDGYRALLAKIESTATVHHGEYQKMRVLVDRYFESGLALGKSIFQGRTLEPELATTVQETYNTLVALIDQEIAEDHARLLDVFRAADENFRKNLELLFTVTVLIALCVFIFVPLLIRKITQPIVKLESATRLLGQGNLDLEVTLTSNDEFQDLGESFNYMVKRLREKTRHLEDAKNELSGLLQERLRMEEQIRCSNQNLELANSVLKEAMAVAETANKAKSAFLANMSHEIRTPMNAILGYTQILGRDPDLSKKQRKALESIERGGNHLLSIINDILDISKIEAGRMEVKAADFDLNSLLADLSTMLHLRCEQNKLEWRIDAIKGRERILLHGDEGKIRQVLINLLGNAVKFTAHGYVHLKVSQPVKDRYHFEVIDTGAGIPAAAQPGIFEPFHQEEAGVKKGGTGLGLTIAKKQVEMMGGELLLESTVGKGSRFHFTLPLPAAKETVPLAANRLKNVTRLASGRHIKALVVDDNRVNREMLMEMLTPIGVEVIAAENGLDAVEKTRRHIPDIVFMDFQMPVMTGDAAIRIIQSEFGRDKIKMVVVSASAFDHERALSLEAGAHDFIAKPFTTEKIFEILAALLHVEFEYMQTQTEAGPAAAPDGGIAWAQMQLPAPLLARLREAAAFGQITEMEKCCVEIEAAIPDGARLAELLRDLMDKFDIDGLLNALNRIGHG